MIKKLEAHTIFLDSQAAGGVKIIARLEDDTMVEMPVVWAYEDFKKNTPIQCSNLVESLFRCAINALDECVKEVESRS